MRTAVNGLLEWGEFAYNRVQVEKGLFCWRSTQEEQAMT